MNFEAKKAVDRVGINPLDLQEKTLEEFKHQAKDEGVTDEIIEMRYFHHENRRRKKLKILADYIRNNRHCLGAGLVAGNNNNRLAAIGGSQANINTKVQGDFNRLGEIQSVLRTGNLTYNLQMQATRLTLPKTDILSKKLKKESSTVSPSKFRSNDYTTLKAHKDRAKYQILDQVKKN